MYWSILKTFINGKMVPIIPPLLANNNVVSNFREKVNVINDFFVQQCQPVANHSILPGNQIFNTQNRLRYFDTDSAKILKLLNGLNPHQPHSHDGNSIPMLKLCNLTITKLLSVI